MLYTKELSPRQFMKLCIFLLCCLCYTTMKAEYKPMLKVGRIWNCIEVYQESVYVDSDGKRINYDDERWNNEEEDWYTNVVIIDTVKITYHIDGTEMIDNRLCYKLYSSTGFFRNYYEEDGKVYALEEGEWVEGFDFTLEPGDSCPYPQRSKEKVSTVDTISMGGELYRRLSFGWSDDVGNQYWIESVGSTVTGPYISKAYNFFPLNLLYHGVMSVYDGETCLFERKDFQQPSIGTGVKPVPNVSSSTYRNNNIKATYDLYGRRLAAPPAKGVYVSGGRKYVVK